jgi:hypothetical protein
MDLVDLKFALSYTDGKNTTLDIYPSTYIIQHTHLIIIQNLFKMKRKSSDKFIKGKSNAMIVINIIMGNLLCELGK